MNKIDKIKIILLLKGYNKFNISILIKPRIDDGFIGCNFDRKHKKCYENKHEILFPLCKLCKELK